VIALRPWKLIAIAGAIAGLVGFFLPFVHVACNSVHGSLSAYEVVTGVDNVESWIETGGAPPTDADRMLLISEFERFSRDYAGGMLVIYMPALLLLLVGLSGFLGGFGRGRGGFALLFGIAAWGIWGLFRSADSDTVSMGIGLHLLLFTGLAGVGAAIGAFVRPDVGTSSVTA
jgi:hypothetical protein